tara:strand:+ start:785 stop:1060 length:276 start_codon:yes stop_codon:yes gene_type:complete
MVKEVLPHSGKIMNLGYSESLELVLGTDTRQHEQMGRLDSPGAQHNTVRFNVEDLAAALYFHAYGILTLKQDLPDQHPAPHCKVETVAHGS